MFSKSCILKFYKNNPDLSELYSPQGKSIIISVLKINRSRENQGRLRLIQGHRGTLLQKELMYLMEVLLG